MVQDDTGGDHPNHAQHAPIAIGGVGGSGTRVVQQILAQCGFFMGGDLNGSVDNLWYTFLFVRPNIRDLPTQQIEQRIFMFEKAMTGVGGFTEDEVKTVQELAQNTVPHGPMAHYGWLKDRAQTLLSKSGQTPASTVDNWGWKEPNTHVVLPELIKTYPKMKYVHVIRNGLDMAYSDNQNQPKLWAHRLFGIANAIGNPRGSLRYWCAANQRVLNIAEDLGDRFFLLSFDDMCRAPRQTIENLIAFVGMSPGPDVTTELVNSVQPPASIGRYKAGSRDDFEPKDIDFVASLGFDTSW